MVLLLEMCCQASHSSWCNPGKGSRHTCDWQGSAWIKVHAYMSGGPGNSHEQLTAGTTLLETASWRGWEPFGMSDYMAHARAITYYFLNHTWHSQDGTKIQERWCQLPKAPRQLNQPLLMLMRSLVRRNPGSTWPGVLIKMGTETGLETLSDDYNCLWV